MAIRSWTLFGRFALGGGVGMLILKLGCMPCGAEQMSKHLDVTRNQGSYWGGGRMSKDWKMKGRTVSQDQNWKCQGEAIKKKFRPWKWQEISLQFSSPHTQNPPNPGLCQVSWTPHALPRLCIFTWKVLSPPIFLVPLSLPKWSHLQLPQVRHCSPQLPLHLQAAGCTALSSCLMSEFPPPTAHSMLRAMSSLS